MNYEIDKLNLPEWISSLSLKKAVGAQLGKLEKIISVMPNVDEMQRRNCTIILPIKVKALLKDHTIRKASFVLKAQHSNKFQTKIMNQFKMFYRERQMYQQILPKFTKLFKSAGKDVTFAPRAYRLDLGIGVDYILLDDLKSKNFRNVNRAAGFEITEMKEVLKKLAEFHAVSACYVETYGPYPKLYTVGVYSKANRAILKELNNSETFLSQLKRWRVGQLYYNKVLENDKVFIDRMLEDQTVKPHEFNVLNHSDCWINNVMFKYDTFGKIENTKLLDYQVVKYGSPAYDLIYVILSSANRSYKLEQFDYLVQFYFYYLLENLNFLNYKRMLPQLATIQEALACNGLAAYVVVSKVLPIVMMDTFEDDNNDNYQSKMKWSMFANRKYVQAMSEILPWLDHRGYLDWK